MTDLDREIDARIKSFAAELTATFQAHALAALARAAGGVLGEKQPARRTPAPAPVAKPPKSKAPSKAKASPAGGGGRRSPAQLQKTMDALKAYVAEHPGARMEHIGAGLKMKTAQLVGPVAKLLGLGELRREGQKRATQYFPGGDQSATVAANRRKRGK